MVSTLDEVKGVQRFIEDARMELKLSNIPHNSSLLLGLMIEVPSAALLAGKLAREVDYLTIGTNDLTQYTLAVDRNNKNVAHMYDPMNPAMLNLISATARAAREANIPVAVCGEIAADPLWTPLLIGLGIGGLSMNASSIPLIKRSIRLIRHEDCVRAARRALKTGTSADVRRIMSRFEKMIQAEVVFQPKELH
jgi:phosphotransferase system enzyme I (PtsI)